MYDYSLYYCVKAIMMFNAIVTRMNTYIIIFIIIIIIINIKMGSMF